MRVLIAALLVVATTSVAFVIGRSTAPDVEPAPETNARDVVGRVGDVFRFPAIALFCTFGFEIDSAMLICNRTGDRPRYQVVFERNSTSVGRIGYPGNQRVFPERP